MHKKSKPIWVKPKAKRLNGKRGSEWGRRNHEPAETQIQLQIRNEIENAYMCVHVFVGKGWGRKSQLGGQLRIENETRTSLENEQENPQGDPLNWRC